MSAFYSEDRLTSLPLSSFLVLSFSVDSSVFQLAVNLYRPYVFWCSNCSSFDQREPCEAGPGVFLSHIHHSLSLLSLYTLKNNPGSCYIFSVPALESAVFQGIPSVEMAFEKQDLGTTCVYYYWDAIKSKPS